MTQQRLIVAVAGFVVVSGNISFFSRLLEVYEFSPGNMGFLLSVPLVLGSSCLIPLSICSSRYTTRLMLSLILVSASLTAYFADYFGTVVDEAMIHNALQTDVSEVSDLFAPALAGRVLLLGIIPSLLVWCVPLARSSWRNELRSKLLTCGGACLGSTLLLLAFSQHYASFFRDHKPLRHYTNPGYSLYSIGKYLAHSLAHDVEEGLESIGLDAVIPAFDHGRELVIMVVGETARADRFSLNGYHRETNPRLAAIPNLFTYTDVVSCGTSTAVSLPCMFAASGRDGFDLSEASHTENVLDLLQRVGVSVLWRDNNSSSKGVALRVAYEDFRSPAMNPICDVECRDEGMLAGLQDYIDRQQGDILIVLHQKGNHGPAYYKRYPRSFEKFTPACRTSELSECTREEIDNAYDNAILYTDHFLAEVIELLESNTPEYETAMLYVSDHGESLGEHRLYLHGLPYAFAPREQTRIPVLLWLGSSSDVDPSTVLGRVHEHTSHDAVFHSLLKIFEVETGVLAGDDLLFDLDRDADGGDRLPVHLPDLAIAP